MQTNERSTVHAVLDNEYLLDHITSFLSRRHWPSCLRVNNQFFAAAGRHLYRIPPTIDANNIVNFFSGALIGFDVEFGIEVEPLDCDGRKCPKKMMVRDAKANPPKANAAFPSSPASPGKQKSTASSHKSPSAASAAEGSSKLRTLNASGASTGQVGTSTQSSHGSPGKKKKNHGKQSPSSIKYKRNGKKRGKTSPRRNFKEQLLSYVRVFSLGTHHSCICKYYGDWELLPNVEILRVVPHFVKHSQLEKTCDSEELCTLLSATDCNKLVFRNMDVTGLQDPGDSQRTWMIPSLKEVVYFIPPDTRKIEDDDGGSMDLWEMSEYFHNAASLKVVLYDKWELDGKPYEPELIEKLLYGEPSVVTDTMMFLFQFLFQYTSLSNLLVGLDAVTFDPWGDLTGSWEENHPETPLVPVSKYETLSPQAIKKQQKIMYDFVKNEVNQGVLSEWFHAASWPNDKETEVPALKVTNNYPEHVQFQGMDAYIADRKGRKGEICATD